MVSQTSPIRLYKAFVTSFGYGTVPEPCRRISCRLNVEIWRLCGVRHTSTLRVSHTRQLSTSCTVSDSGPLSARLTHIVVDTSISISIDKSGKLQYISPHKMATQYRPMLDKCQWSCYSINVGEDSTTDKRIRRRKDEEGQYELRQAPMHHRTPNGDSLLSSP
jgi:hypothetical protein